MTKYNIPAGAVVNVEYAGLDNITRRGICLVIYNEGEDQQTFDNNNILVMKITSQMSDCPYKVRLYKDKYDFLKLDSYVLISKLQITDISSVVYHLGFIDNNDMMKIFKTYTKFKNEMERQMLSHI